MEDGAHEAKKALIDVLHGLESMKAKIDQEIRIVRAKLVKLDEKDRPPLQRRYGRSHSPTGVYRRLLLKGSPKGVSKGDDQ